MKMLELSGLQKNFHKFTLGPIDLALEAGSMNGLVGPNGSGKTTLFRCIIGTVRRSAGTIRVAGRVADASSGAWRNDIGYVGDYTPLFDHLTGAANLVMVSKFHENWSDQQASSLVERFGLDLKTRASAYSTGQRAQLAVVMALAHRPRLLLLDEPANGLDPVARSTFLDILYELMQQEDLTLVYATHHIDEIERLADQLILLSNGQVLERADKEDLVANWRLLSFRTGSAPRAVPGQVSARQEGQDFEVVSSSANDAIEFLRHAGASDIQVSQLPLERICVEILKAQKGTRP